MDVLLIADGERPSALSEDLLARLSSVLEERGHRVETFRLRSRDAAPCRGCLLCLTKHPGRCVTPDTVAGIASRTYREREGTVTVFVTPVLFGHFSSVVKNAIDRGTGSHRLQVFIGCGHDIDAEEESTFMDLIGKHRGASDVVHPGMDHETLVFVARSTEENAVICEAIGSRL